MPIDTYKIFSLYEENFVIKKENKNSFNIEGSLFSYKSKCINFILIIFYDFIKISKKKLLKVCLCIIGKKENRYAKEFVEHYKKIGYNKIFIYDNNEINDEKFEDVIQDEIDEGFASIINYRGFKAKQFRCYKNNNKSYDWLSFF